MDLVTKNRVVTGTSPVTTNTAVTADYISMKNVLRCWIVVTLTQAAAHATGIDPVQATAVAGTGKKAFTKALPIYVNEDVGSGSTLTAKTPAVTYNVSADVKNKKVVFLVDAEKLDVRNGFDCLGVTLDASSKATNFVNVEYICEMRYQGAEVITD